MAHRRVWPLGGSHRGPALHTGRWSDVEGTDVRSRRELSLVAQAPKSTYVSTATNKRDQCYHWQQTDSWQHTQLSAISGNTLTHGNIHNSANTAQQHSSSDCQWKIGHISLGPRPCVVHVTRVSVMWLSKEVVSRCILQATIWVQSRTQKDILLQRSDPNWIHELWLKLDCDMKAAAQQVMRLWSRLTHNEHGILSPELMLTAGIQGHKSQTVFLPSWYLYLVNSYALKKKGYNPLPTKKLNRYDVTKSTGMMSQINRYDVTTSKRWCHKVNKNDATKSTSEMSHQ